MNTRLAATAVAAATAATLSACAGSDGTSAATDPSAGIVASVTSGSTQPAEPPAASPPSPQPAAAGGACSLIDQGTAGQITGISMPPGKKGELYEDDDGITKLDGCAYLGDGVSIGYDVITIKGISADQLLAMAQAKSKAALAKSDVAKAFEPALPKALGVTTSLPKGVDSQVTTVRDVYLVTVAVTRADKDVAASQDQASQAAQAILANL